MVFSTIIFLFRFLPITLALYYLVPPKFKNTVLFVCSLIFYSWGEVKFFPIMLVLILLNYVCGLCMEKCADNKRLLRLFLIISVVGSLSMLVFFKYTNFIIRTINALAGLGIAEISGVSVLPLGISFYTFQTMSYSIDVFRGQVKAEHNIIDFGAYVVMFPQLIAGPIVRYADVREQLNTRRTTGQDLAAGLSRFVAGLSKKVLLANTLYALVTQFKAAEQRTVLFCWLYALAYVLHLYFDFSGYSDMAIGLGRIFGFHFPENFQYPYISRSVTEFWRRWHISLGTWFRDYVYIPLGGNRVPRARWVLNLAVVWALTGLWHGAAWNFVAWGLLFAVLLLAEKLWLGEWLHRHPALGHFYVLAAVLASFVLFDADSVAGALGVLAGMAGLAGLPAADALSLYCLRSYAVLLLLAAVGSTPWPQKLWQRLAGRAPWLCAVLGPVGLAVLLVLDTAFLVDGSFNPFLYFRF